MAPAKGRKEIQRNYRINHREEYKIQEKKRMTLKRQSMSETDENIENI
jgi:hypothetical protein